MNNLGKLQSKRKKNGEKWQHKILSIFSSKWESCDLILDDLETTKTWNVDLVNHEDKIFLELTTSVKDGKEAKVIIESKVYKHHYPDYKFVVGVKKASGRISDGLNSHIDHLNQTSTIDQVLVGEDEIIKFMNKPFYNKRVTINNKTQGVVMNNNTIVMDTILYGVKIGDQDGVTKLIELMSEKTTKKSSKPKSRNSSRNAAINKRKYFMKTVQDSDLVSEPTMSLSNVLVDKMGHKPNDFERFMQSKEATSMMKDEVKMIDKNPGSKLTERYHLRVSDIEKYVS